MMLVNRRTVVVEWGDCDPNGIVFNPHFFAWFDASVHALLKCAGLSLDQLIREYEIAGLPLGETQVKFLLPLRYGDEIIIETKVVEIHRCSFNLQHRVMHRGVLAVECSETRVMTAFDPLAGRLRALPLPPEVVQRLSGSDITGVPDSQSP